MNYYNTIWDTIDVDCDDGQPLRMVHGYDKYFVRYILWLKRPNSSVADFVCYKNIYISGMALSSFNRIEKTEYSEEYPYEKIVEIDSPEVRLQMFTDFMYENIDEAKGEIIEAALPYIEDGCVLISGKHGYGPWTNLMPEQENYE